MSVLVATDPIWTWRPHPEVWLLVGSVLALGFFTARVVGPKAVEPGEAVVTGRQKVAFFAGVLVLWLGASWPLHDIAEQRLYSAHMFQHLLFTMVLPPLFLLATPSWLARLIVTDGGVVWKAIQKLSKPVVATIIFQGFGLLTHWPTLVNEAVANGPLHYTVHTIFVLTGLLLFIPVCGPWPELRLSLPGQMVYLFVQSVVPTIPAAWLANASSPVYSSYDHEPRLWGISVMADQVAAGMIMKLAETMYLWGLIGVMFFKWAARHQEAERLGLVVSERDVLFWDGDADADHDAGRLTPTGTAEPPPTVPRPPTR